MKESTLYEYNFLAFVLFIKNANYYLLIVKDLNNTTM